MIKLKCQCGAKYCFQDSVAGKRARCKKCGAVFVVNTDAGGSVPVSDAIDLTTEVTAATQRAAKAAQQAARMPKRAPNKNCPSCEAELPPSARICTHCGINIETGRSLLTTEEQDVDVIYDVAQGVLEWLSYFILFGVYPVASEAIGGRRPYAVKLIAILTVVTSVWLLVCMWTDSPKTGDMKQLMLWAGTIKPPEAELYLHYILTEGTDREEFRRACMEIKTTRPELSDEEVVRAALEALPPAIKPYGQYRNFQLITHAFVHGSILHLAGNLIFLLVLGSRINAVIGNIMTMILYLGFAVAAGLVQLASMSGHTLAPVLGASGAVMGMAGLYLTLFPLPRVHTAAWVRFGRYSGSFALWIMSPRGVWVVLFYVILDVVSVAVGFVDNVAHWAHLGGFLVGVGTGLILLITRSVHARGCDVLSLALGKHAWALVGRPDRDFGFLQHLP